MSDALGTPGGVVSDEDHRLAMAGMIAPQSSSLAVRTGVMWGPGTTALVTGTSATGTMTVNVNLHHWVTTRGTGDGVYLGAKESSTPVNIAAAPGSNSRIDVVYSRQKDSASTISPDGATAEEYGVVTGTAAASPTKPSLTSVPGAIELATVQVAAGATSTNGAGVTITNTAALTVARGADIPVRSQTERDALTLFAGLTVIRLDVTGTPTETYTGSAWRRNNTIGAVSIGGSVSTSQLRVATGVALLTFSATNFASVTVNYSAAGFTAIPVLAPIADDAGTNGPWSYHISGRTTTQTIITIQTPSGAAKSLTLSVPWTAVGI